MKYSFPEDLKEQFSEDMALQKIINDGEEKGIPQIECYAAITRLNLDRLWHSYVELGRYRKTFGPLPALTEEAQDTQDAKDVRVGDQAGTEE